MSKKKSLNIFSTYSCFWIFSVLGGTHGWGTHTYGGMTILCMICMTSIQFQYCYNRKTCFVNLLCIMWYFEICIYYRMSKLNKLHMSYLTHLIVFLCWESWVAYKQQNFISHRLKVDKSSIKVWQFNVWWGLLMGFVFLLCSHMAEGTMKSLRHLFKGTSLILEGSTLITQSSPKAIAA